MIAFFIQLEVIEQYFLFKKHIVSQNILQSRYFMEAERLSERKGKIRVVGEARP
jgi:hypothetical protein